VTVQGELPLESTQLKTNPIAYFEIKIVKLEDKDLATFGVGLAGPDYAMQRPAGGESSLGIRGDGKIFIDGVEESACIASPTLNMRQKATTVGVGLVFRTQKVFFTLNGKEVY